MKDKFIVRLAMDINLNDKNNKCVGMLERFSALVIDNIVLLPLTLIQLYTGNAISLKSFNAILVLIIIVICMQLYHLILPVIYGGTIGKRVIRMKILNVNGEYL